jgi:RHS repeat-associated protein
VQANRSTEAGRQHSLARQGDGTEVAWGEDLYGELGDANSLRETQGAPVAVQNLTGTVQMSAGFSDSLAMTPTRRMGTTYTYDRLYRLIGVTTPGSTTSYMYDPLGNRLTRIRNAASTTYQYDKADRIQQTQDLGLVPTTYTVDANGNTAQRGTDTFTYDQANRLTSVGLVGAQTFSYKYDGDGKRTQSGLLNAVPTATYTYDVGGGLPRLLDDGSRKYVWGLGEVYNVDKTTGSAQVYHTDGLGSVRALTDSSGAVTQTYKTDEFGIPDTAGTVGTSTQPLQYTGEQRDAESSFVYLRARMYDPSIGRFMQADRLRKSAPGVSGWNRFSFVENNPATAIDPSGLRPRKSQILEPIPCIPNFTCPWLLPPVQPPGPSENLDELLQTEPCAPKDPRPEQRRGVGPMGFVYGLVRGPEGGAKCHVNVQVSPAGTNFHVQHVGGEYVANGVIYGPSAEDVAGVLASFSASEFVQRTVGESWDAVVLWFETRILWRLVELAEYPAVDPA